MTLRADSPRGTLIICPTPLGNLEDITLRVLRALRESDVIFAEDTRVTKNLLRRFDIATPLRSFPENAQAARLRTLRELLEQGKTVAMVSDAGMPGISDPGTALVLTAREVGAMVDVLPGPSAVASAVVASGFDANAFRFEGFPPRRPSERQTYLKAIQHERAPVVWFEAPTRVAGVLADIAAVMPNRHVFVLREYTKKFEQQILGTAQEVLAQLGTPRGEFTLVLEASMHERNAREGDIEGAIRFLRERGLSARDAAHAVRCATGISKNELYRLAVKERT